MKLEPNVFGLIMCVAVPYEVSHYCLGALKHKMILCTLILINSSCLCALLSVASIRGELLSLPLLCMVRVDFCYKNFMPL